MRSIVHIGPLNLELPARFGGAIERRMIELAVAQANNPENRVIVYSRGESTSLKIYRGVAIRYWKSGSSRVERRLSAPYGLVSEIRKWEPAVVHVHNRPEIAWLLRERGFLEPVVLSCDCHYEPLHQVPGVRALTKAIWHTCLNSVDVVAPVSEYCAGLYQNYWRVSRDRMAIVPNGVDLRHFRPDPAAGKDWRRKLGLEHSPIVLYAGRVCRQKGTDLLVEACRLLRAQGLAFTLVVVGPPDKFGKDGDNPIIDGIRQSGGIHLPPVSDEELPGLYNASDVFVMPTRDLEMFGMAAIEAQACGKPVVASDHGGLRETVPSNAGLRFPAGDAAALAAKLAGILKNAELRGRLAQGALVNATQYGWNRVAARCQTVYEQARCGCSMAA